MDGRPSVHRAQQAVSILILHESVVFFFSMLHIFQWKLERSGSRESQIPQVISNFRPAIFLLLSLELMALNLQWRMRIFERLFESFVVALFCELNRTCGI